MFHIGQQKELEVNLASVMKGMLTTWAVSSLAGLKINTYIQQVLVSLTLS